MPIQGYIPWQEEFIINKDPEQIMIAGAFGKYFAFCLSLNIPGELIISCVVNKSSPIQICTL